MAGVSTGVNLLTAGSRAFRTLGYTAPSSTTRNLTGGTDQYGRVFMKDGRTYTREMATILGVDGNWASPTGNEDNPEQFTMRWLQVSGYILSSSTYAEGVWYSNTSPDSSQLIVEMLSIPTTPATYTSVFTFQVRDSNLTTIISTNITLNAVRT